ncbi:DEAD/DEAH box helicase [Corticibacter populi]|uniref:DEAD/DEAH box helicase n=1 Tax=Corticibacter populi TaxID=1550736 RepID=A0A3M6R0T9_9BURK|nr:DEAD/DEAH box helicase [Corticibacter populi]RMX08868.1 DEAD/DEAH box helicase [Corticibacter populi]RZS35494.1 helicase-like protein [Corticibacter populi]
MFKPVVLKPPELLLNAASDGRRIGLQLTHVPGLKKPLEAFGAWWCGPRRMWVLDRLQHGFLVEALQRAYAGQYVDLDAAPGLLKTALEAPSADYFTQLLDVQIFPLARGELERGRWAVSFAYDKHCVRAMHALGGYFQRNASAWQVHGGPDEILQALAEHAGIEAEFVFIHERPVVLEDLSTGSSGPSPIQVPGAAPTFGEGGGAEDEAGTAFISTDRERDADLPFDRSVLADLLQREVLRDYQAVGVEHLVRQSGACLGDDMGLGKSRQTVVALRLAAGRGRVLIACPASLRLNWEREIRMVYPDAKVGMLGEDRMATLHACDWVVGNYERMGGLVREVGLDFAAMAVDEAHYLKEHRSGRTRNMFVLAARIPRAYVVTGTPLLNREVEMHTLLRITGHELGRLPLADFRKQYAGSSEKRAALAEAIKGWMLRRSKSVLKDLGTKERQLRYISPAEGLDGYKSIYGDMTLTAMPKIVKLRRELETLKIPFLVETVEGMAEDDKIIIFCEYMSTVEALKQALAAISVKCVSLVGSDSAKKRQKAVDTFQEDPETKVFIGTTSAAGVGITLTAANIVAFASMPWTPALMRQAEDRAYRLGQKRDVLVLVPIIPGTIDEGVLQLQENKRNTEIEVVEAVRCALPETQKAQAEVPEAFIEELEVVEA